MLIKLMLGLLKFKKKHFVEMRDLFEQLSSRQNPETLFITCSDSRIVPSLITNADPGDLFNIRNVGNIIPPYPSSSSETSAIEYSLQALEIKDIIICGHSNCGAMKGLLTPHLEEKLPSVASWLGHSHTVLKEIETERTYKKTESSRELEIATKKNIVLQMEHLKTYPWVMEKIQLKQLTIHGWYYELETGQVFIYEPELQEFINLESALDRARSSRKIKIVSALCMDYLQQKLPLKSEQEYEKLIGLTTQLQEGIHLIWEEIRELAKQQLWKELGGFYSNSEDEEFLAMVESSKTIKISGLEEFRAELLTMNPAKSRAVEIDKPEQIQTKVNKTNKILDVSLWIINGFMDIAGSVVALAIVVLNKPFVSVGSFFKSIDLSSSLDSVSFFSVSARRGSQKIMKETCLNTLRTS